MDLQKIKILSTHFSNINLTETIEYICSEIDLKKKSRACVVPVNCVIWAENNQKLLSIYNSADLVLADGVPIVWASKLLNTPLRGRVTGLDLLPDLSKVAAVKGYTFFFLGAKDGVGVILKESLQKKYPALKIVGIYSPPFADKFSDVENKKIISMINAVKPNVLWVSLTAPKQDYWIHEHIKELDVNIAIGVGGAFEVTAGLIERAPIWMQRNGLEWLFRFIQEPRRLFRRYFIEAPQFIPLVFIQYLCRKR